MGGDRLRILRFAVGTPDGPCSSAWSAVSHKGDVYVNTLGVLAGVTKFSFHKSRNCRHGFTCEHGAPLALADRALNKWRREATPPAGSGRSIRVLSLYFPTDFLSTAYTPPDRALAWVEPAPPGGVTIVEMLYVGDSRERVEADFRRRGAELIAYAMLPTGEAFAVVRFHRPWKNEDSEVPDAGDGGSALLFSSRDPHDTGRPVRHQIPMMDTNDGPMALLELGGHAVPIGSKFQPGRSALASSLRPKG